ncbi:HET-domain-containing protein [Hypoxylon sp. FL1284]|nr:HET-domain-containing protein [Hypoxylon sp. FL1284]
MESYCYVPFGTETGCRKFRVLTLLPGSGDQPLECILEHGNIGDSPPYETISYVWGDPRDKVDIICNSRTLSVNAALAEALRHFRSPSESRRSLWADAICINQDDVEERGRQVRCMKDIYSKASRVLIWLGGDQDERDIGIAEALHLAHTCRRYISAGGSLENLTFNDSLARELFGKFTEPSELPRLAAFAKLVSRLWFTRVWVVQEVALATEATVFCGHSSIDWSELMAAITAQDYLELHLADHERNAYIFILERARREWSTGVRRSLLSVLFRYRILDATDPRDKIFGLNALIRSELEGVEALQPNYNVGITELYTTSAKEIIRRSQDLNLLSVPRRISGAGPGNLSSWVPDWTNTRLTAPLGLANYSDISELAFAAAGSSSPVIDFGDDSSGSLAIHGHCVDRIVAVGALLRLDKLPRSSYHGVRLPKCSLVLDDWSRVARLWRPEPYIPGESMREAFAQTLSCGSSHESTPTLLQQLDILERNAKMARWLVFLSKYLPSWVVDKVAYLAHAALFYRRGDKMTLDFRIHLSSLSDRRVFGTEKGYIGLGCALAEVGDEIAVVKGAKVPLVLRPTQSKWTLQGDCYLRGVMQGEAYREDECSQMWII